MNRGIWTVGVPTVLATNLSFEHKDLIKSLIGGIRDKLLEFLALGPFLERLSSNDRAPVIAFCTRTTDWGR
jgi:hypothetical protein